MSSNRQRAYTGSPWEQKVGFCRAMRVPAGSVDLVYTAGTAPISEDGSCFAPGDARAQTAYCFSLIERALAELGAGKTDIVRTRMFVTDMSVEAEVGAAHAAFFDGHHPCATMVGTTGLVNPEMLVEIEVEAVVARGL